MIDLYAYATLIKSIVDYQNEDTEDARLSDDQIIFRQIIKESK
jgi:hypothetical protein